MRRQVVSFGRSLWTQRCVTFGLGTGSFWSYQAKSMNLTMLNVFLFIKQILFWISQTMQHVTSKKQCMVKSASIQISLKWCRIAQIGKNKNGRFFLSKMEDFNKTLVIYSHFWWFQNPNLPFYHNTLLYGMWSSMKMPLNISPENKVSYLCRVFLCLSWMMKDLWKKNPEKFLSRNVNVVVIVFSRKKQRFKYQRFIENLHSNPRRNKTHNNWTKREWDMIFLQQGIGIQYHK